MSGGSVFTTIGRDKFVQVLQDALTYFKFGEGGFVLSGVATEIIEAAAVGGVDTYDYTVTGGDFAIIGVDQGTKKFTINGDYVGYFPVGTLISVEGSVGNDQNYTVVTAVLSVGDTVIEVAEAIPSAIVDGVLYASHLPIAIGPGADTTHWPLVVEERTPGDVLVQSVTDTTGTGSLTGDGTGTVNYKNGDLHVEFAAPVGAGNRVQVVFKYHDQRKDAALGQGLTDLEAALSPVAPDGNPELFSYSKDFGGGTPPDTEAVITFRGVGYGTIRCVLRLREGEAIDDGRGLTYGGVPFLFEAGVFTADDVMVAYMTFDKTRHAGSTVIRHTVDFVT